MEINLIPNEDTNINLTYLTVDQAKMICHLSQDTLRKYIRSGKLKAKKVGVRYLIKPVDLQDFIDTLEQKKESE